MYDAENTKSEDLFTLVNIIITCPSLHKMTTSTGDKIYDGEVLWYLKTQVIQQLDIKFYAFLTSVSSAQLHLIIIHFLHIIYSLK